MYGLTGNQENGDTALKIRGSGLPTRKRLLFVLGGSGSGLMKGAEKYHADQQRQPKGNSAECHGHHHRGFQRNSE